MPKMHRDTMNKIADATHSIIEMACSLIGEATAATHFRSQASTTMARSLQGESSSFDPQKFRERALGIRRGR